MIEHASVSTRSSEWPKYTQWISWDLMWIRRLLSEPVSDGLQNAFRADTGGSQREPEPRLPSTSFPFGLVWSAAPAFKAHSIIVSLFVGQNRVSNLSCQHKKPSLLRPCLVSQSPRPRTRRPQHHFRSRQSLQKLLASSRDPIHGHRMFQWHSRNLSFAIRKPLSNI